MSDPGATAAGTSPLTLEERLANLEAAVASLGAPQVGQNHDGLQAFKEWLENWVVRSG